MPAKRPWWRGAVLYQIYPRSFCDSNGDGVGDLSGITSRLDYVAALGVDGIWLSPFFVSPMKDFGYDVADYCDVDPMFGALADFDTLLAAAHRLGLKVIIDQVYSHSSDQHPWFRESRESRTNPKADWYVWADPKADGTAPNNWLAVFGGIAWTWEPRRRQYYFHNFLPQQPDLNLHHREVQDAVIAAADFWLKRGVDGFRVDVANLYCHDPLLRDNPPSYHPAPDKPYWLQRQVYNRTRPETLAFVARFRALLDSYPDRMAVAELASDDQTATMVDYTDGPQRYHTAYSFQLMREPFSAAFLRQTVEAILDRSESAWPSWAFSNHDVVRVATRWGGADPDPVVAKMLIALLVSLRGTIFLYQGEELGLPQGDVPFEKLQDPEAKAFWPRDRGRDGARTPMPWQASVAHGGFSTVEPWLPVAPAHLARAVDCQEGDASSVLSFTRRLLAWRRRQPCLVAGSIRFFDVPEPIVAFERRRGDDLILCAFNLGASATAARLPVPLRLSPAEGAPVNGGIDGTRLSLPGHGWLFAAVDEGDVG